MEELELLKELLLCQFEVDIARELGWFEIIDVIVSEHESCIVDNLPQNKYINEFEEIKRQNVSWRKNRKWKK